MPALRNHLEDHYGVLFACVLVTFVIGSLLPYEENWAVAVVTLLCTATSIDALIAARSPRAVLTPAAGLAGVALLFIVVALITDAQPLLAIALAAQAALFVIAMEQVLVAVFFARDVNFQTILGALSVYGILGLLFSLLYVAVARNQDTPFFEDATPFGDGAFLYFSYATLTSTGYGDLAPAGQPGRMLAGLEMMIGQIFLVTLVAGLVALWRPGEALRRRRGQDG